MKEPKPDPKQLNCVAHAVYHEARGESLKGQVAVAFVVYNRSKTQNKTACEVVYQPHQFTNIKNTRPNKKSREWESSIRTATLVFENKLKDPTKGATFFYAQTVVKPKWASKRRKIIIGNHTFV